jgi:hypothetical protein
VSQRPADRSSGPDRGALGPTGPAAPVHAACLGLVIGWGLRPLALYAGWPTPRVGWLQVGVIAFLACVLAGTAFVTWRELQVQRTWLEPHRAVNRLVMAKSCILVGALLAGGYAGTAVSWLGVEGDASVGIIVRDGCAALAALAVVGAAIWLERACRVRRDDDADLA